MFKALNNKSRSSLSGLFPFLRPYRVVICGAGMALIVAAGTVLAIGAGLRILIDRGFSAGDPHLLDLALVAMMGAVIILALATFARFHLVSWLGERVVADIRRTIFDRAILCRRLSMKQDRLRIFYRVLLRIPPFYKARSDHRSLLPYEIYCCCAAVLLFCSLPAQS